MAKLKCAEHMERAMVLPSGAIVHRSGSPFCESRNVVYAGKVLPPKTVLGGGIVAYIAVLPPPEAKRKSRKNRQK